MCADRSQGELKNDVKDYQMGLIKHLLVSHLKDIEGTENEQVALVFKMFDIIYSYMNDIIN